MTIKKENCYALYDKRKIEKREEGRKREKEKEKEKMLRIAEMVRCMRGGWLVSY